MGANELKVVDLAGAYSAIANQGVYKVPHVLSLVKQGDTVSNPFAESQEIAQLLQNELSGSTDEKFNLFRVRTFMQGVVKRGTARSMSDWYKIIAGKTGTTNGNKDAWFAGFNKEITVVVWVGYPKGKSLGSKYEGAKAALPIFKDFMTQYYDAYPDKLSDEFPQTPNQGLMAVVEPFTGYYITSEFQSDFEYYTGRTSKIKGAEEYFLNESELNSNVRNYEIGSRIAGEFFFNNLGDSYKSHYRGEYDLKKQQIEDALFYDEQNFTAQNDYCKENRKKFPDHPYVIDACAEAKRLKEYISESKKSVGSFKTYYLQSLGFQ